MRNNSKTSCCTRPENNLRQTPLKKPQTMKDKAKLQQKSNQKISQTRDPQVPKVVTIKPEKADEPNQTSSATNRRWEGGAWTSRAGKGTTGNCTCRQVTASPAMMLRDKTDRQFLSQTVVSP